MGLFQRREDRRGNIGLGRLSRGPEDRGSRCNGRSRSLRRRTFRYVRELSSGPGSQRFGSRRGKKPRDGGPAIVRARPSPEERAAATAGLEEEEEVVGRRTWQKEEEVTPTEKRRSVPVVLAWAEEAGRRHVVGLLGEHLFFASGGNEASERSCRKRNHS